MSSELFKGFALLAGYSYPTGYRIYHDPKITASSNIIDILELTAEPTSNYSLFQSGVAAVLGAAAAIGVIVALKRRK